MTKATLFDMARASGWATVDHQTGLAYDKLAEAVPFVIDDDTVRLAQAIRNEQLDIIIDAAMRLPFPVTWIEYDPRAKGIEIHDDTADKIGHMLIQDPGVGVSILTFQAQRREVYAMPVYCTWGEPGVATEVEIVVASPEGDRHIAREPAPLERADDFRHMLLTGRHTPDDVRPPWFERFGGCVEVPLTGDSKKVSRWIVEMLHQNSATQSLLMAMVAILMHCPRSERVMQPSGRWVGRHGRTHPFYRHTVVRVETSPRQAYQRVANAVSHVRRAQHDVRAHWRTIRRGQPDEYRVLVKSHKRGDPEVGIIRHDSYDAIFVRRDR